MSMTGPLRQRMIVHIQARLANRLGVPLALGLEQRRCLAPVVQAREPAHQGARAGLAAEARRQPGPGSGCQSPACTLDVRLWAPVFAHSAAA